jgi:HSP20 family protein
MRLIKYDNNYTLDPWTELDRWFGRALGGFDRWQGFPFRQERPVRVDLYQDDSNYYVVAELPGFERKDVKIELENAVLTITASRKVKEGDEERAFSATRSLTVDETIRADKVKARLEHGLLTITLPKAEESRPRLIQVS